MKDKMRALEALLRQSPSAFLEKTFNSLNPGQRYIHEPYLEPLAWHLEQVRLGKIRRLIINMPPRSLKSIAASVAFPARVLGHDPTARIICVSYSGDLAKKHSNDFRAILEAPWYRSLFPGTRIGLFKNSETEIELTKRGFRLTTSVGGTLTGRGADFIIIDDPLKPDEALSESRRSFVNQWFANTLLSRLDDKRTGAIIVVMQRVHLDDLAGYLLEQSDDWTVLSLPAIAERDEEVIFGNSIFSRKQGDVLAPEREPLEVLQSINRHLGSDPFSAQYQQAPVPPGGAMIKRAWVKNRYSELPEARQRLQVIQSWDTASKGGPDNDWSVCTTWIVGRDRGWYLADVWRARVDYPSLKANVIRLAESWRAHRVLVEDTGAGMSLVQELRSRVSGIIPVRPEGDKISRMAVASAKFQAGQVLLPGSAPWLADLEAELFAFPGARHDDQCDSISQALQTENNLWTLFITPEMIEQVNALSRRSLLLRRRL